MAAGENQRTAGEVLNSDAGAVLLKPASNCEVGSDQQTGVCVMLSESELSELEGLLAKATPGPWKALRQGNAPLPDGRLTGQSSITELPRPYEPRWVGFKNPESTARWNQMTILSDHDADVICALRNLAPRLIAQAREKQQQQTVDVIKVDLTTRKDASGLQKHSALSQETGTEPLRDRDMHVRGELFGLRVVAELVYLYIEDDEYWHLTATFNRHWLRDLQSVLELAAGRCASEGPIPLRSDDQMNQTQWLPEPTGQEGG